MTDAIATYLFIRFEQQTNPIDACRDAAEMSGVSVQALAAALIAQGTDAQRLATI